MPASMAAWMVEMLSASSLGPYMPDIPMQPSARADTGGPLAPSGLVIMSNRLTGYGKRPTGREACPTQAATVHKTPAARPPALAALARRLRRGHGFLGEARNHLVAVGGVPYGGGDDGGILLHIVRKDPFVGVEVGVVSQDVVIDGVLRAAHARQAGVVERCAVGAAGGAAAGGADAAHAEIGEVHEQRAQRRGGFRRPEHARAANASGAGIHVEVDIQLLPFGLGVFGGGQGDR